MLQKSPWMRAQRGRWARCFWGAHSGGWGGNAHRYFYPSLGASRASPWFRPTRRPTPGSGRKSITYFNLT